jgi:RimJ/RimL family protein N-acetyltransferase
MAKCPVATAPIPDDRHAPGAAFSFSRTDVCEGRSDLDDTLSAMRDGAAVACSHDPLMMPNMNNEYRLPEEIQTDRYLLRRVVKDDAEAIFKSYGTDATATRYLSWKPHHHVQQTRAFLSRVVQEWDDATGFPLVAFDRETPDELVGMFHPHKQGLTVSYGYVLSPAGWGKGCATEVMQLLVEHALSHPQVHRTEAFCDVENTASARVLEKAGMAFEGILRSYFLHPNISDAPRDCRMYAKVR